MVLMEAFTLLIQITALATIVAENMPTTSSLEGNLSYVHIGNTHTHTQLRKTLTHLPAHGGGSSGRSLARQKHTNG